MRISEIPALQWKNPQGRWGARLGAAPPLAPARVARRRVRRRFPSGPFRSRDRDPRRRVRVATRARPIQKGTPASVFARNAPRARAIPRGGVGRLVSMPAWSPKLAACGGASTSDAVHAGWSSVLWPNRTMPPQRAPRRSHFRLRIPPSHPGGRTGVGRRYSRCDFGRRRGRRN
ncbi:MAG: hypothetical protein RL077_5581 [Verrucomicrobiota bacterium]